MKDRAFLSWLHARCIHHYGESPHVDWLHKLRGVVASIPPDQESAPAAELPPGEGSVLVRGSIVRSRPVARKSKIENPKSKMRPARKGGRP